MSKASPTKAIDRLPPHSPEAEQGVLGCILLAPNESMPECILKLKGGAECFYDLRHQEIYGTFLELFEDSIPIDIITVQERLKVWDKLESVGGLAYLSTLPDVVPSAANLSYYLDLMVEKFVMRRMIHVCTDICGRIYDHEGEAMGLLDEFEIKAMGIRDLTRNSTEFLNIPATLVSLQQEYDAARLHQTPMGVPTTYTSLDRILGGMMPQEMIVVAGQRSTGKTTLAMNIGWRVAETGRIVGIVSLETSGKKVLHRIGASDGYYNGSKFMRGVPDESDDSKMAGAFVAMHHHRSHLIIDERGGQTPSQVGATARRMVQQGAVLIIIDYLQLLNAPGKSEYERATSASKAIKEIAKQCNVPVIIISSLSRDNDKEQRKPRLSDLRNSGQIEFDADKAILLHFTSKDDEGHDTRKLNVEVAKHKDGPVGSVEFQFFMPQFRMEQASMSGDAQNEQADAAAAQQQPVLIDP